MATTRRDLEHRLAALDEEREAVRANLAALDAALARLLSQVEHARAPEEQYTATWRRLIDERDHLMSQYDARVIDTSAGHVAVISGSRPVPREVERRIVEVCRALRQLEVDRADALRGGLRTVAGALADHEQCRIARALTAQRLAELGG